MEDKNPHRKPLTRVLDREVTLVDSVPADPDSLETAEIRVDSMFPVEASAPRAADTESETKVTVRHGWPRAISDLRTQDHSKGGKRYVTVLAPDSMQVVLLDEWEYSVLILCDGTRSSKTIAVQIQAAHDVPEAATLRCLQALARQSLLVPRSSEPPPRPRASLTAVRAAEWRLKDQEAEWVKNAPPPPSQPQTNPGVSAGLEPTLLIMNSAPESAGDNG
jgi:hypothetical protein